MKPRAQRIEEIRQAREERERLLGEIRASRREIDKIGEAEVQRKSRAWGRPPPPPSRVSGGMPAARQIRLKGGKWGAEVSAQVERGDVINLTLENGETERAVVGYVRWKNARKSIVELDG